MDIVVQLRTNGRNGQFGVLDLGDSVSGTDTATVESNADEIA